MPLPLKSATNLLATSFFNIWWTRHSTYSTLLSSLSINHLSLVDLQGLDTPGSIPNLFREGRVGAVWMSRERVDSLTSERLFIPIKSSTSGCWHGTEFNFSPRALYYKMIHSWKSELDSYKILYNFWESSVFRTRPFQRPSRFEDMRSLFCDMACHIILLYFQSSYCFLFSAVTLIVTADVLCFKCVVFMWLN